MALILVGLNHRTAAVDVRERLNVEDAQQMATLAEIKSLAGIDGVAVLSTCNRVEVVASAASEDVIEAIVNWLSTRGSVDRSDLERHLYVLRYEDVIRHLFRVASGLDSMVLGEPQIGGQVRAAFLAAQSCGALDGLLEQVFEETMRVAKKVRTDTGIGEHAVSVPYAAVELARKIFGDLRGLQALLLGAGEVSELTAEHLNGSGLKQIFVANRSHERAQQLASRFNGQAIYFEGIESYLSTCDIVIASTSAPHYVIEPVQIERALGARKMRTLFLIDLSVPRNIHPDIGQIDGAYLYNIDDLQQVADSNRELRMQKAQQAEAIVTREMDTFRRRLVAQDAVPTILELQQRLESIRAAELEKCLRKLGPITASQRESIEMLTSQMVNKILHYPILRLKDSAAEPHERESLRETIRKIFGLR
ncbi:MAG TPA: glutamyl-tRNA reductase [Thermoanaerobaculia bacterium]|nr:glutamyl-tRNA reductase [Thermoanaerobaculia bacterium]